MSLFKSKTLTVNRPSGGARVNGRWVPGSTSSFTIKTSVQPANGKDLEALEEGQRTSEILKIYPSTELKTIDQHISQEADIVVNDGKNYTVVHVGENTNDIINHYKCLIMRVKE